MLRNLPLVKETSANSSHKSKTKSNMLIMLKKKHQDMEISFQHMLLLIHRVQGELHRKTDSKANLFPALDVRLYLLQCSNISLLYV